MTNFHKKSLIVLLISSSVLLSACHDDKDSSANSSNGNLVPIQPITYVSYISENGFIDSKNEEIDSLENASRLSIMKYKMPNVLGKEAEATAIVMYPKVEAPKDGWRVVVWEHGTLGIGDHCAQSKAPLNERVRAMAEDLLALGYVVIAVDYEGLGTPGIHPYLHLESEAKSAIYAVKAFKEKYGTKVNGAWMSVGQSQGGQASLGTAEYANNDVNYKGAVAGAPASNLGYIITQVAPQALASIEVKENEAGVPLESRNSVQSYATLLAYAALVGVGIKAYEPDFNYLPMFEESSQKSAKLAEGTNGEDGLCLTDIVNSYKHDIITFMNQDTSRKVMDFPGISQQELNGNAILQRFMSEISQPGTKPIDKPILVIQGEADTNVPYAVTTIMVNKLKVLSPNNQEITLLPVPNATHTQAIDWKRAELVEFIQKHMPVNKK